MNMAWKSVNKLLLLHQLHYLFINRERTRNVDDEKREYGIR